MKKTNLLYYLLLVSFSVYTCSTSIEVNRVENPAATNPHKVYSAPPWIMRLNLDNRPQMIGVALNKDLYAAYDARLGALYKVWKGDILFTGPVYDNIHGRQPITRGAAYIQDTLSQNPWSIKIGEKISPVQAKYKGYTRTKKQVTFKYEIPLPGGETATIEETPEWIKHKSGRPGFERVFKTSGLPQGTDILLSISFEHLTQENDLETNGKWSASQFEERSFDFGKSTKASGTLRLNHNDLTLLRSYFEPKATEHVQLGKGTIAAEASKEQIDLASIDPTDLDALAMAGKDIIGKSDCAACHAINKMVIGPAYTDIAKKYETKPEVVEALSLKIIHGGAGAWGTRAMSAHPDVSETEAKAMAAYILATIPDGQIERQAGVAADFYDVGQPLGSLPEIVAGQSPNASEVYPTIDFRSGNPDIGQDTDENFSGFVKDFVMEVNTYLNVPESKTYDLQFVANNGGQLIIDGQLISQGHYYEGTFIEQKQLFLEKGAHKIQIHFYHHLFNKYLILMWRDSEDEEYEPIPAEYYTHDPFDIKPTSPGIKAIVQNNAPGFGASLLSPHPAFDLSVVRPEGFQPRVGDLEFRDNGNLVLCTWDGEIFELENPTSTDPANIKITKIADGLCEPLGITIVDDEVYVLQRWELTKLIDRDGDNITDEYQSIATFGSNGQFHEWSFGLVYKDGHFYCTTGIAMGWGADNMHVDRGKALKIAMDGSYEHIAYGLKEPNGIGIGPGGEIFVTDNEGEYQPVCKVFHIPETGKPFYGNKSVEADHLPEDIKDVPPVIWLPQNEIGNSPSQPILMKHGPYEGQMIHGEITHGGIKRDFIEKVKGQYQGAVFRFSQGLEVGINRMEWGPDDALYVSGLGGAQDFGHQGHQFGLERLTYNGNIPFEMLAIRAKSNGLEIEFTKPLRIGDGTHPDDYIVQQWYFSWSGDEQSSQQKKDLENLIIHSVTLSDDRTRTFLELDGMKKEHVYYVQLQPTFLSEDNEQLWSNEGWYTLNKFPDEAGIVKPDGYTRSANSLSPALLQAGWKLLFDGQSLKGWTNESDWAIEQDALAAKKEETILTIDKTFDNFELEFDWKLTSGGEGGILFNIPPNANLAQALMASPRMQLVDEKGNEDAKSVSKHKSGANYDIREPKYVVTKPTGVYNTARLVVQDNLVEHWINGIKVVTYELGSEEWQASLAGTIYENSQEYGLATNGSIGVYTKKGKLSLRNVRIRGLDGNNL